MAFANEKSSQTKDKFLGWLTETKKWPDVAEIEKAEEFEWEELLSFDEGIWKEEFGAMKARIIAKKLLGEGNDFVTRALGT